MTARRERLDRGAPCSRNARLRLRVSPSRTSTSTPTPTPMPSPRALLLSALTVTTGPSAPRHDPPTVQEIVTRYIAARGGLERIRSVRNLILRGPRRPDGRPGRWMARARPGYFVVGEPGPSRDFGEGFDGSAWEFYGDPGIVIRTTDAPAAAARHTSYFDDPLVSSLDGGWRIELLGADRIGDRPAWRLGVTFPDGFRSELFVDQTSWLIIASRKAAPIHAFGNAVTTETRISDYRNLNGALFPMRFDEYVIATGQRLDDMSGSWETVEFNVPLPLDYFSPPAEPRTPLARMLNAVYADRGIPSDALRWYRDFRANPATAGLDTEAGIEAVGYQCLKNGAIPTGVALLEANLREHPKSAAAHFGVGRAYRAAGREADAMARFRQALALDPGFTRARDAIASRPATVRP